MTTGGAVGVVAGSARCAVQDTRPIRCQRWMIERDGAINQADYDLRPALGARHERDQVDLVQRIAHSFLCFAM
jgi:hypothetical protein